MNSQIKYDAEIELSVPTGNVLKAVIVNVDVTPKDAGVLIYGNCADGTIGFVEVRGSQQGLRLPFINGHVYIKHVGGLESLQIAAAGWVDDLSR